MIDAEFVRQILDYNFCTGEFRWKARTPDMFRGTLRRSKEHACANWNARYAGAAAGWGGGIIADGYCRTSINKQGYLTHRLAWLYMTGEWPKDQIDHIDGCRSNNRFANLRLATSAENGHNRAANSNNTSGFKGVTWDRANKKWRAMIMSGGKTLRIGRFDKVEDAAAAYARAAHELHGEFARAE